jgi:slit protein 2
MIEYLKNGGSAKLYDLPRCNQPEIMQGKQLTMVELNELSCQDSHGNVCTENGTFCPFNCTCEDSIIRCSSRQLTQFPDIPLDTTELYLDNNQISELLPEKLNKLVNLVKLDLSQNNLTFIDSNTFSELKKLSTLILSYNQLKCLGDQAFNGLTSLRILSLHG